MVKLNEVFGVANGKLMSYVSRDEIDQNFQDSIELTDHHVVVFGETKVGKSHLRKKYISKSEENLFIDCTKGVSLKDLYMEILNKSGAQITDSLTKSFEETANLQGEMQAGIIDILKAKISGSLTEKELTQEVIKMTQVSTVSIQVAECLLEKGINLIVLDDFHYLNLIEQFLLAYDLKMFYQKGIRFVIIGTKISVGYFEKFNGELSQRIDYIDATKWSDDNFNEIISKGCSALNIRINPEITNYFIGVSNNTVAVLQYLLFDYCKKNDVRKKVTGVTPRIISDQNMAEECNEILWKRHSETYFEKVRAIARGVRKRKLQLYYYIMRIVISSDNEDLKRGLSFDYLFNELKKTHPLSTSLNQGSLTSVLNNIDELQVNKEIFPKLFTYYNKRLYIVDSLFYYVIKHFNISDIEEILPQKDYQIHIDDDE